MNQRLREKIKKIKLIATDVDGVLTDGGMYYSSKGDILKKFQVKDGMAASILKRNAIPTVIITKERNQIVKKWSSKMNIDKLFDGIKNKEKIIPKLCKSYGLSENNIAYIGDDVNDLEVLKAVGFSALAGNSPIQDQFTPDYVTTRHGGNGAFREFADIILNAQ